MKQPIKLVTNLVLSHLRTSSTPVSELDLWKLAEKELPFVSLRDINVALITVARLPEVCVSSPTDFNRQYSLVS